MGGFLRFEEIRPMYESKGQTMSIQVISADYLEAYRLRIHFNDGTEQVVDFAPFLAAHPHPQYEHFLSKDQFRRFHIENGHLVWGKDWDLVFPVEQLHRGFIPA